MKVTMIGTGYVGLVTGACFADLGHEVACVEIDERKLARLQAGEIPIYEPGLEDMVARNVDAGRISFTAKAAEAVPESDAVFICVGTPPREDGDADLSYVYAAARDIAPNLRGYTVVVDKSTVPVGTGDEVTAIIQKMNPDADFDVASNPEFLREGNAIDDFMKPDRVVIGVDGPRARAVMQALYRPLTLNEMPILYTGRATAELTKYAANAFLAMKVTFINEIADICERVGADVQDVSRGIGLDSRIGTKFLQAGAGFGGSCFPKDTLALTGTARKVGRPTKIVEAVMAANDERKRRMAGKIIDACNGDVAGKTIGVLGVTFKPNTDDMRDAPSLDILPLLQKAGARIRAYDPEGMGEARKYLSDIEWTEDAYGVMPGADALLILTEWNEFRVLDLDHIRRELKEPLIVDLRNIYRPAEMAEAGFTYHSVGRETAAPKTTDGATG
ncbi:UDP-glucose/GDP-mannose dehydrogenase family protein [Parvibaculum sp.]|uniref:UDP-glucose dehydrogenase family protein n=2 Tax=Parvibaculum sp. TaxID=2024848 RepID=UPI001B237B14|nr:UDP-glucose/GDP-mannose dehydrogenase family protein [Parvibaculum sp.]MBO6679287.1 UDP-glucose/GDP-mannose dehydrogenase family protein [Parvibaculum sp.]MBO6906196.1 UDP-glucose/GDP-mannose dehydrogenase family protein [Parvibaculum sp.]